MRDKSDLNGNQVKVDYQTLQEVLFSAVGVHKSQMERYRHEIDNGLEEMYQEMYNKEQNNGTFNAQNLLHSGIHADMYSGHLFRESEKYHKAIHLLHIVMGAVNREEFTVVNLPFKREKEED